MAAVAKPDEHEIRQQSEGMLISSGPAKTPAASREENFAERLSALPGKSNLIDAFDNYRTSNFRRSDFWATISQFRCG